MYRMRDRVGAWTGVAMTCLLTTVTAMTAAPTMVVSQGQPGSETSGKAPTEESKAGVLEKLDKDRSDDLKAFTQRVDELTKRTEDLTKLSLEDARNYIDTRQQEFERFTERFSPAGKFAVQLSLLEEYAKSNLSMIDQTTLSDIQKKERKEKLNGEIARIRQHQKTIRDIYQDLTDLGSRFSGTKEVQAVDHIIQEIQRANDEVDKLFNDIRRWLEVFKKKHPPPKGV